MMTPVLLSTGLKNSKGRLIKKYELRHRNLLADDQPCDLASQSKVWHACISWFWKHSGHAPGHIVPKCTSMAKYGYSIPCKGLSCGVILYDAVSTQQALWKAFHTNRGTRRNLKGLWRSYPTQIAEAGGWLFCLLVWIVECHWYICHHHFWTFEAHWWVHHVSLGELTAARAAASRKVGKFHC